MKYNFSRKLARIAAITLASQLPSSASGQMSPNLKPGAQTISAPSCYTEFFNVLASCSKAEWAVWLADIRNWRSQRRLYIAHSGERYEDPASAWIRSSFVQTQVGVEDRYLFDVETGKYTVDRYLQDLKSRYGGIDSVLVWPFYPNSGIDARNQMDVIRTMPGGLEGVRNMVTQFHRRGVKVLFPMMMWDQGTRDPGLPWPDEVVEVMKAVGADGVNGDTFDGVPLAYNLASDKFKANLVFEPELAPDDRGIANNLMSWGYYEWINTHYGPLPMLDRRKWIEPRHMIHVNQRWAHDRTNDLQTAFFMGTGYESWENVWGIWNGITSRDAELVRRYAAISRFAAPYLTSEDWEPFHPTEQVGIFASRWPIKDESVWTLVNRTDSDIDGIQLKPDAVPGLRYFDLYHGIELTPRIEQGKAILSFGIEGKGIGAIFATRQPDMAKIQPLLDQMRNISAKRLDTFSSQWKPLPQHIVKIAPTIAYESPPAGMLAIPAGSFDFRVNGFEIEDDNGYVDVQYPWETQARRNHLKSIEVNKFFMDRFPVTNGAFSSFLKASNYHPKDAARFVPTFTGSLAPRGGERKPVTNVSIEDARAYCAWAGKRLPREWEWQYAAGGKEQLIYPWGNGWSDTAVPLPDKSRSPRPADDVGAHPAGASPFGVQDLVGLVWQWTDEYQDEHTRSGVVRGGTYYQPSGSMWYFRQAYRNDQHNKILLMAPSKDRSPMIGFRCAADARQ